MAIRVPHGDLIRDLRLWYPLDWYLRVGTTGKLPLFVFLDDGRGAEQFANDVGIASLVRPKVGIGPDPFHPTWGTFDFSGIVALFLEAPQVADEPPTPDGPQGRQTGVWSTPSGPLLSLVPAGSTTGPDPSADPGGDDRGAAGKPVSAAGVPSGPPSPSATGLVPSMPGLGLLAAGRSQLVFPVDDLEFVTDSVARVISSFNNALGAQGIPRSDGITEAIDEERIFLVGMGSGATLALVALGNAVNPATALPLFAGACVIGGTIGGKAINDPSGLFPGVVPVIYAPTVDVTEQRLLSLWWDFGTSSDLTVMNMRGTTADTNPDWLVPAADSALELADIGYPLSQWASILLPGPPVPFNQALQLFGDFVRLENTHGFTINTWAAAIWPFPFGPLHALTPPFDPSGGAVTPAEVTVEKAATPTLQVAIWHIVGMPHDVWPTSQVGADPALTFHTSWEPLVEIIRFLLDYP